MLFRSIFECLISFMSPLCIYCVPDFRCLILPPFTCYMLYKHTRTHTHTHTRTNTRTRTNTHTRSHTHTLTHRHTHTHMQTHTHTRSHVHTITHTQTHTYTRTHTYIRAHTNNARHAIIQCNRTSHLSIQSIFYRRMNAFKCTTDTFISSSLQC